jgi:hypothetical protein
MSWTSTRSVFTDQASSSSKECKAPKDWSRVKCSNCEQMGHGAKRCKEPVKQADDGFGGENAGFEAPVDNGFGSGDAGFASGGGGEWNQGGGGFDPAPLAVSASGW